MLLKRGYSYYNINLVIVIVVYVNFLIFGLNLYLSMTYLFDKIDKKMHNLYCYAQLKKLYTIFLMM